IQAPLEVLVRRKDVGPKGKLYSPVANGTDIVVKARVACGGRQGHKVKQSVCIFMIEISRQVDTIPESIFQYQIESLRGLPSREIINEVTWIRRRRFVILSIQVKQIVRPE